MARNLSFGTPELSSSASTYSSNVICCCASAFSSESSRESTLYGSMGEMSIFMSTSSASSSACGSSVPSASRSPRTEYATHSLYQIIARSSTNCL